MRRSRDGESAAAQLENRAPERMADTTYQFFGRMYGSVSERFEQLVRLGESFADGR